jgi:TolB protein
VLFLSNTPAEEIQPEAAAELVFVRDGNIFAADADGRNIRQLTSSGHDRHPALSPDGMWVVFQSDRTIPDDDMLGFDHVYLMRADGTDLRCLTGGLTARGESPSFSPDGEKILFVALRFPKEDEDGMTTANMSVATMNLKGGDFVPVVKADGHYIDAGYLYAFPRYSPDGRQIVYADSFSDVSGGFHVVEAEGGAKILSSPHSTEYYPLHAPCFAPDGKSVVCYRPDYGGPGGHLIIRYPLNREPATESVNSEAELVVGGKYFTFSGNGRSLIFEKPVSGSEGISNLWRLPWPVKKGVKPELLVKNASEPSAR